MSASVPPRAGVVVLAGPSGSGKSRLAARLGWPVLRLDDFYRDGDAPDLPRTDPADPDALVDWDHVDSWDAEGAYAAIDALCGTGRVDHPVYDLGASRRVGHRVLERGTATHVIAEGLFAPEVVEECRRRGLLADAVCVRHHRVVTFALRLVRDLREHRKPPAVLVRRGWRLMRAEPEVVAYAVDRGCRPLTPRAAERELRRLGRR